MGHSKSSHQKEIHSITSLPQEMRKKPSNNLTLNLRGKKKSPKYKEGKNKDQSINKQNRVYVNNTKD